MNDSGLTPAERDQELKRCALSPLWFTDHYGQIYDATERTWIPFDLWREQGQALHTLINNQLVVILKARQLGMTWLMLAYALWLMLFRPAAVVLLFSRRDDEAMHLLERLKGMYNALPPWMQELARLHQRGPRFITNNDHVWEMGNGSTARAFPPNAGDSYTASFVLVDEADLVPDLGKLMASVKPTIDGGGKMALVSRVDKSQPNSEFKNVYRAARLQQNTWVPVFLAWYVRPGRSAAWYEAQRTDSLTRTGGLDYLWEQYPETEDQALAPNQKDKRLPAEWLLRCYEPRLPLPLDALPFNAPTIPGLEIYTLPVYKGEYVIGADTAEGNPTSDDSTITILDANTGEEVAALAGKLEPATQAAYIDVLSIFYNNAPALVERNNHGHTVIQELRNSGQTRLLRGFDTKFGWLTTERGKALMYDDFARELREGSLILHSAVTYTQLASIEGATLKAPEGDMDDRAVSIVIANQARGLAVRQRAKTGHGPAGLANHRG